MAAGIRGGKGVDASVVEHPQLFVTLTAPSFGPVHSAGTNPGKSFVGARSIVSPAEVGAVMPPRRPLSCAQPGHEPGGAIVLGDPLCAECF